MMKRLRERKRRAEQFPNDPQGRAVVEQRTRPRVVIIGAGFGGLASARALRSAPV